MKFKAGGGDVSGDGSKNWDMSGLVVDVGMGILRDLLKNRIVYKMRRWS